MKVYDLVRSLNQLINSFLTIFFKLIRKKDIMILRFVFRAFYLDQKVFDFLDTFSTFSVICKEKVCSQKFWVYRYKKEYDRRISINELV